MFNETCPPWNMLILICAMWCSICPRCNMSFPPWHMQRDILQCDVHCTIWWVYILSALSTMTCAMCNETCPPWNMLILKLCTAPMCTLCKCNVQCAMRQVHRGRIDRKQSMFLHRCINNRLRGENTVQMFSWEFGNNKGIKSSNPSCKKCTSPL